MTHSFVLWENANMVATLLLIISKKIFNDEQLKLINYWGHKTAHFENGKCETFRFLAESHERSHKKSTQNGQ